MSDEGFKPALVTMGQGISTPDGNAVEIPLIVSDEIMKASDNPILGDRRLVRLLPTPFGSRPSIWISPYTSMEICDPKTGIAEKVRKCIVLISKGPPHPDVAVLTIPVNVIEKFPLVPVEW